MKRSTTSQIPAPARKAWRALLAASGQTLGRRATLMRHQAALLPRFAAYYTQIAALPRRAQRRLLRPLKLSLASLALLLAVGQAQALAATIQVNGTTCTLVDAITAANNDTAVNGCTAGSGADTLVLPANSTIILNTVNNSTFEYGANGLPLITSTITIDGNGATVARDSSAPVFRIFDVRSNYSSGNLTLNKLTISGGAWVSPGHYTVGGGGIANRGTLTLNNSTVSGNTGTFYAGIANAGMLTLNNSTVSGNTGTDPYSFGGGIGNFGTLLLNNSTVSGNTAFQTGGIHSFWGTETLVNSTVSGNTGGGIFHYGDYGTALLTLIDSTVSGNSSAYAGGGISTLCATATLAHSLVSGNTAPDASEIAHHGCLYSGTMNLNNFNLIGHDGNAGTSGFTPSGSDIVPSQPLAEILGPLANNGGPTMTHALVAGSPAVDVVPTSDCAGTDQRGVARPQGLACDIGAFEREPSPPGFAFNGFFAPVSNQALNAVKAGQAIPVRFSLGGNRGLNIFEGGYPAPQQVTCDLSGGTSTVTETTSAGSSSLAYDALTDTYTFVWKTEKGWSNSCRRLLLRFTDGSTADAEFRFTK